MTKNKTGPKPKHTCCSVEGCKNLGRGKYKNMYQLGFCHMHYKRFKRHGDPVITKHCPPGDNIRKHELYSTWSSMCKRVYNTRSPDYKWYGARGIKVCDRWRGPSGFINFAEDMGKKPFPEYSLDREDVNGDYSPENCRWAHQHQQTANTRANNRVVGVYFSKTMRKWHSIITVNRVSHRLGFFVKEEDAIKARKDAEKRFGIKYKTPHDEL